ncbi:MAG: transcription antitermination factor NusB [Desulfobulbaceae bacterium]|nr:transcription antitermination factor NusB [Desulfobulbaceae bacterium]MCK5436937.1 transcription antitermination factor NusB [Desulfobulbaceae bacterium]
MGARRKARELALQTLYQCEVNDKPADKGFLLVCEHFMAGKKAMPYAKELVSGVTEKLTEIDSIIQAHAANWRIPRMSLIDRNILRIAAYELCFSDNVPASVAINEAIEIAKRYSTEESGAFINGILDALRKSEAVK